MHPEEQNPFDQLPREIRRQYEALARQLSTCGVALSSDATPVGAPTLHRYLAPPLASILGQARICFAQTRTLPHQLSLGACHVNAVVALADLLDAKLGDQTLTEVESLKREAEALMDVLTLFAEALHTEFRALHSVQHEKGGASHESRSPEN